LPDWDESRALVVDVTVVAPHAMNGRKVDTLLVGAALKEKDTKKEKRYRKMIEQSEVPLKFLPFAVSSFGNMGEKARELVKHVVWTISDQEMLRYGDVHREVTCQLVSAVIKPLADGISNTLDQRGFELSCT